MTEPMTALAAPPDVPAPMAVRVQPPTRLDPPPAELGLTWRPLTDADVPGLHALVTAIEEADRAPVRTDVDELAERFEGGWKDLPRDTLGGVDRDGRLRAWGFVDVRPGDSGTVRAFLEGGVHPQWRGQGVGRAVLAWLQGRGRQKLAASGKELPARLVLFVEDDAVGTQRLAAAAGFTPRRYYRCMRRDLAAPVPTVPPLAGLRVVPWSAELDDDVRLAHNDAFRDHWGSEPATPESWAGGRAKFAPAWSFVALDEAGDRPVVAGYALSSRYEQDWTVQGYTSGYTATLGVRRAYRRRGVAPALLAASMAAFRADGMQFAELDVDSENPSGAHGLYARLGYEVVRGSAMYSIEL